MIQDARPKEMELKLNVLQRSSLIASRVSVLFGMPSSGIVVVESAVSCCGFFWKKDKDFVGVCCCQRLCSFYYQSVDE